MTKFGRCLAFHLRYWDEMDLLYYEDRRDLLKGEPDPETLLRMINGVGMQAEREGADFLEACANAIEGTLCEVADTKTSSRDEKVQSDWQIRIHIQPKKRKGRGRSGGSWKAGVTIERTKDGPAASCWLWGEGGRDAERLIRESLGVSTAKHPDDGWSAGTVVLRSILLPTDPETAELDRARIVEKVAQAFAEIPLERYQALLSLGDA